MISALEKSMGIVSDAAKKAKVSRSVHYDWLKSDKKYKMEVDSIADIAIDFAESKLMQNIRRGSDTAIIFYLKTKGKSRGYIERQEVTPVDETGKVLKQVIIINGKEIEF